MSAEREFIAQIGRELATFTRYLVPKRWRFVVICYNPDGVPPDNTAMVSNFDHENLAELLRQAAKSLDEGIQPIERHPGGPGRVQ